MIKLYVRHLCKVVNKNKRETYWVQNVLQFKCVHILSKLVIHIDELVNKSKETCVVVLRLSAGDRTSAVKDKFKT